MARAACRRTTLLRKVQVPKVRAERGVTGDVDVGFFDEDEAEEDVPA